MRLFSVFLLLIGALPSARAQSNHPASAPRVLEVDRLGSTPYKTISSAAKIAQPGDTIRLKPNTGPYRDILAIRASGTEQSPIIFDGGGNLITGFDPLTGWEEKDGVITCRLPRFPRVLTYRGERLVQDFATGKFTKYADLNEAQDTLTLRPGVGKEGWEFSKRSSVVQVNNVSYHIYRNIRASGSTNDGFNLHGTGTNLVFENIEGFHNMDEGYSAHDSIQSTIRGGKFWGNDNGLANSYTSANPPVSTTLQDVDLWDNLGRGLVLHDCTAVITNVRCWNNGVTQIRFDDANIRCEKVIAFQPKFTTRPWTSYHDTKGSAANSPLLVYESIKATITGTPPKIETSQSEPVIAPQPTR